MSTSTTEQTDTAQAEPQAMPVFVNAEAAYRRQREQIYFAAVEEGKALQMNEAPEGGRYVVNGVLVDANCTPIQE